MLLYDMELNHQISEHDRHHRQEARRRCCTGGDASPGMPVSEAGCSSSSARPSSRCAARRRRRIASSHMLDEGQAAAELSLTDLEGQRTMRRQSRDRQHRPHALHPGPQGRAQGHPPRHPGRASSSRPPSSACRGLKPEDIEDVVLGCAMPEAEQGMNVARIAGLLGRPARRRCRP